MSMRDDRYRPFDIEELEDKPSLINEPVRDEVIELRPGQSARSLYALLVGLRNQAQALLDRSMCPGTGSSGRWCGCSMWRPEIR
jgi:hypothetical protein